MTLVEMLLALFVFSFVMAGALAFLRAQGRSFSLGSERVAMYQNTRYVVTEMEKDLRTAGSHTTDQQPQLVYGGASVFAFNGDYWTNTPGDPYGVYYNPDAPDSAVQSMTKVMQITIPQTSFAYPDTSYLVSGVNTWGETIIFYFAPDSTTARADDYVLYRKVNNLTPEVVARNILQTGSTPFLQYYKVVTPAGGGGSTLALVGVASLPLKHSAKIHLAPSDTGPAAIIDSVRAVRVSFTATNGLSGATERLRTLTRMIRLPNAGLVNTRSCGDVPILGTPPVATASGPVGTRVVKITWNKATDESGGEKDVERYMIWKRLSTNPDWGDPYVSIPSGTTSYSYTDGNVTVGTSYYYALAAEDCTPSLSTLTQSNIVTP